MDGQEVVGGLNARAPHFYDDFTTMVLQRGLRTIGSEAAVISQLRIPSLTPSQFPPS
jgi:hypothetical protein